MDCKTKIILSWILILSPLAAIFLFGMGSYALSAICFFALLFRDTKKEIPYWKSAGKNPGIILKALFTWSLLWLAYILFEFYSSDPIGSHTLSATEWASFGIPIVFVYIFYEIQLFKHCEKYYNA
jgi:hypothetical protein